MAKTEVEVHDAQSLSYDMRDRVIEECQKRAKINPATIIVVLFFCSLFAGLAIKFLSTFSVMDGMAFAWLFAIPFILVPVLFVYNLIIRPKQILKLALNEDYTYYMGRLTDKKVHTSHSRRHTSHTYYLYLDDSVKCDCDRISYSHAKIGEQYIALYFNKKYPEMCIEASCNGNDINTYDSWDRFPQ